MSTSLENHRNQTQGYKKYGVLAESSAGIDPDVLEKIKDFVVSVKFGYVQIVIQDGKVVQIDKTEKCRVV
jgi:hypothetical protein